jgi:hypothetical protein
MKIQLDLSSHCIETEIKRLYHRALSDYFNKEVKENEHIEKRIDLTRQALETLDFSRLRSEYTPLAGRTDQVVILAMHNNKLSITIDGRPIEPTSKDLCREKG